MTNFTLTADTNLALRDDGLLCCVYAGLYQEWLAAGNTPTPYTPTPEQIKAEAQAAIDAQLAALDLKRIRPTAEGDATYLATLNAQAVALRAQRAAL